jgi:hypothetical protein
LRAAWRVSPKLATFIGARGIDNQSFSGITNAVPSQKYAFLETGFEWRFLKEFSLVGTYNFADRDYAGVGGHSNTVGVTLVYEPHRPVDGPAITVGY